MISHIQEANGKERQIYNKIFQVQFYPYFNNIHHIDSIFIITHIHLLRNCVEKDKIKTENNSFEKYSPIAVFVEILNKSLCMAKFCLGYTLYHPCK